MRGNYVAIQQSINEFDSDERFEHLVRYNIFV
jgi:hypothetical protein